jgi:hypothetical protein
LQSSSQVETQPDSLIFADWFRVAKPIWHLKIEESPDTIPDQNLFYPVPSNISIYLPGNCRTDYGWSELTDRTIIQPWPGSMPIRKVIDQWAELMI